MSTIDSLKNVNEYINTQASKVLHEAAQEVKNDITISTESFAQLFSLIEPVTGYNESKELDPLERDALSTLLKKVFTYMNSKSTNQDPKEVKKLTKEIIILSSKLYSIIVLNEPSAQPKTTKEETKL